MTSIKASRGDITSFDGDAIVNAANSSLRGGGGVDGAIHRAGGPVILEECQAWVTVHGPLPTGQAMATSGGELRARLVIHTVGPVWGEHPEADAHGLLASCYVESLDLAALHGCASIAFPAISTGAYGFPKTAAAETAVAAVTGWIEAQPIVERVEFVCFGEDQYEIYSELLSG